jgi:hypothetical protein
MAKSRMMVVLACSVLGAASGCGADSGDDNHNPVITDLSVDHDAVLAGGGVAAVTVLATDADGDPLQYAWSVNLGALDATAGPGPMSFTAGAERGTATITVTVTDGQGGTATQSVDLGVLGWAPPASAGNVTPGLPFSAVGFASADDGVIAGGSDEVAGQNVPYIYHYAAGAWTDETKMPHIAGHLTTVAAIAPTNLWVAGGGGLAFHNDGTGWTQFTIPGGCVHGLDFVSADDIWATPAEGQAYMRQYTGGAMTAWTQFAVPASSGMGGVSMASADDGWAVGNAGRAIRFDGSAWQQVDVGVTAALKTVDMLAPNDGWIVGASGTLLHWDGAAWTPTQTPAGTTALNGVYAVATDDVWVVGNAGTILHWDGAAWALVPSGTTNDLAAITMISATDGWIVGAESTILHLE